MYLFSKKNNAEGHGKTYKNNQLWASLFGHDNVVNAAKPPSRHFHPYMENVLAEGHTHGENSVNFFNGKAS